MSYEVTNRLSSITGVSLATSHTYDWRGWRTSLTDSGYPAINFTYDLDGKLLEENDNGTVTDHIYADGRPLGIFMPTSGGTSGTMYYVADDRIGTPQFVTNSSGATVWSRTYPPFGTPDTVTGSINYYLRFPGQYADNGNSTDKYNLNRFYYDLLGRYLQADPIGLAGGLNPYAYAGANPFVNIDPSGMDTQLSVGISGTEALLFAGVNGNVNLGISYSDPWDPYSYQVFASEQVSALGGAGMYLGYGVSGGYSSSNGPLTPGVSASLNPYAEIDLGDGFGSVGLAATFPGDTCPDPRQKTPVSYAVNPPVRFGNGIGAFAGAGNSMTTTVVLPSFSQIEQAVIWRTLNLALSWLSPK